MASPLVENIFPILQPPPEIRNNIWRYAVVSDEPIKISEYMIFCKKPRTGLRYGSPFKVKWEDEQPRGTSLLAVAFTCRQLYREVSPIYYGQNIFQIDYGHLVLGSFYQIQMFADAIGRQNTRAITQLHMYDFPLYRNLCLELSVLPNLKRVHLDKGSTPSKSPEMTWYAKKNRHLTIVYDGEVWGPEKWALFPENGQ